MFYIPELPEVETIKLGLQKYLIGKIITDVDIKLPQMVSGDINDVIGGKVIDIARFGKGLVISLDNNFSIAIHIKLTGQLVYRDEELGITNKGKYLEVPNKFTYVTFVLSSNRHPRHLKGALAPDRGSQDSRLHGNDKDKDMEDVSYLYYSDVRQFGWIKIVKTDEIKKLPFFKELGPEPLVSTTQKQDKFLSEMDFEALCKKYKTPIKVLMMDQKKMSGVGNIYANDSLWCAEIDPRRAANSLSPDEVKKLFQCLVTVLKKGIEEGGSSELTYVNVLGNQGNYQNHTLIYGKTGQKCPRCGDTIIRIELGGRGAFISGCQK